MKLKKMNWILALGFLAGVGCSDDPKVEENNPDTTCGAGESVEVGGDRACVYRSELIEEGFECPASLPTGFLLGGGGVACVVGQTMPDLLAERLGELGYGPENPECFGENPQPSCFYTTEPEEGGAFDLTGAAKIEYRTYDETLSAYCVDVGDVLEFSLDLETNAIQFGIGIEGEDGSDRCVNAGVPCVERAGFRLELTETQVDEIEALVAAVPAPQCTTDPEVVCGESCVIPTLLVDSQEVSDLCCGTTVEGFREAFYAVVDYVKALQPEEVPVFDNADSFATLTYTAGPGFGYCINEDQIVSSTITRQGDGTLSAEGFYAAVGTEGVDECIPDTNDACLVSTAFGPMTLSATAQTELEARLAALPAPMCMQDPGMVCDPCIVQTLTLDETEVSGDCCGNTLPGFGPAFVDVVDSIEAAR